MRPHSMSVYGRLCGGTRARAHARSGDRVAIAAYLGKSSRFDNAVADFADAYADQNERDHNTLAAAASIRLTSTGGTGRDAKTAPLWTPFSGFRVRITGSPGRTPGRLAAGASGRADFGLQGPCARRGIVRGRLVNAPSRPRLCRRRPTGGLRSNASIDDDSPVSKRCRCSPERMRRQPSDPTRRRDPHQRRTRRSGPLRAPAAG
jgi:hypothetical protein